MTGHSACVCCLLQYRGSSLQELSTRSGIMEGLIAYRKDEYCTRTRQVVKKNVDVAIIGMLALLAQY